MDFKDLLLTRRSAIIKKWFYSLADTYQPETSKFLKLKKNRFSNPVGYIYSSETEILFDELVRGHDPDKISTCLEKIIKIRAIQDFSPSQAIGFLFALKSLIRDELSKELQEEQVLMEALKFEARLDELALTAFDLYMACREKVYRIKEKELRNNALQALQASGQVSGLPGRKTDFDGI